MYEYLDLLPRKLDNRQKQVCCRADNTVVAAGAGSGKTQVLATRFAWLVMSKNIPAAKILTLTFTKKAAGEMYERIYNTLSFFSGNEQTPTLERERARKALSEFGETHIQTLDSYCANIVRQAANRYGIRPDFTTGSADTEREIKDAALPFILKNRNRLCVQTFARAGHLQDFAEETLAATINNYTSLADPDDFFTQKCAVQRSKVIADFNWFIFDCGTKPEDAQTAKTLSELAGDIQQALDNNNVAQSDYLLGVKAICSACTTLLQEHDAITEAVLCDPTEEGDKAKTALLAAIDELIKAAKAVKLNARGYNKEVNVPLKILREELLPSISALAAYIREYNALKDLFLLFDEFHAGIKRTKRISGSLSFRDVQKLALRILQEQDDLRTQEYAAYDKIMIDEFQDNNGENRALLFLLCSPASAGPAPAATDIASDKLFFVGDEKQSIYKFRGADVAVFNELQDDFIAQFGNESVLPMEYNYRSNNALITSFNRLFGGDDGIFDNANCEEYEAKYKTDTKKYDPIKKEVLPPENLTAESVKMHFCVLNREHFEENKKHDLNDQADFLEEKEQLAYYIAKRIKEIYTAEKKEKDVHFRDFAVLDKSRTDRKLLIKWLNAFGIPYSVDQNSSIFASGLVYDIYNFLRLCVYPSDLNAYAAYLTSPFAGLTENEAETVLALTAESPEADVSAALSAEAFNRYKDAQAFFTAERTLVLSEPLTQTLETLWTQTGYYYETLLTTRTHLSAEQFDMLYELARQCDQAGKSVAWFVDQLALLRKSEESSFDNDVDLDAKEVTYPVEKDDAVQLLTIHKSKGLQYDHVFVYGCFSPRSKTDSDTVFFDETYGVSIKPQQGSGNYFVILQRTLAKKKELAEFRRLIYVAITRAVEDVYLVGAVSKTAESSQTEQTPADNISLKLLEKQLDTYYPEWREDLRFGTQAPVYKSDTPFAFTAIMPVERAVYKDIQKEPTAKESRKLLQESLSYASAADTAADGAPTLIVTTRECALRTTPSALEAPADAAALLPSEKDPYTHVNAIIEKHVTPKAPESDGAAAAAPEAFDPDSGEASEYDGVLEQAGFSYADFGTLSHACLESYAHGNAPEAFEPAQKLFKDLTEAEARVVLAASRTMATEFAQTALGKALADARAQKRFYKAEYAFRTVIQNQALTGTTDALLVTGSIDVLFQNADGSYTIVDYKTDQCIKPAMYYAQQACYRTAAARLLHCAESDIRCYLHYLRFNKAIDITDKL